MSSVGGDFSNKQANFDDVLAILGNFAKNLPGGDSKIPDKKGDPPASSSGDLPDLHASSTSGLSLESLVNAISFEQRKQACRDGVNNLEAKAEEVKETNAKELEELAKQIEEMAKKKILNGFLKAFQIIGAIIGAIAAVATIAVGFATGNPLLIAGGVMAAIAVTDTILSLATDGEISMAAGFTELGKKMGMSDEDAAWFGMGMQMAFSVATIAVSLGGSFGTAASAATSAAATANKVISTMNTAQKMINIGNAGLAICQGGVQIGAAIVDYRIADSQAMQKELEAILERLQVAMDMEKELLEAKMERANGLLEDVNDIVANCNETQTAIATATPSFA